MYLDNVPLDIAKPAVEIIFDKINAVNGLQLPADQFTLGEPEIYSGQQYPLANTKLKIVPKLTSQFYNSFTIYYSRMSIIDIFDNPYVSVARGSGSDISDIIPEINEAFGIYLTQDDYYDGPLPAVDPSDPDAELLLMFTCQPSSILFYGQEVLTLNKVVPEPELPILDTADIYFVVDDLNDQVFTQKLMCRGGAGDPIANFNFMRNADTVNFVSIFSIAEIKYLGILVFGNFDFDADLGDGQGLVNHETNCILISTSGKILKNYNDKFGAQYIDTLIPVKDTQKKYLYFIDNENVLGTEPSRVYRFLETGNIDDSFTLNSQHPYVYARVDAEGRIYAATEKFTVLEDHDNDPGTGDFPVPQFWIDRYVEDSSADPAFTRIVVRARNLADPWAIANIEPIESDQNISTTGVYYSLVPEQPIAVSSNRAPTVNNAVRLAGTEQSETYAFLPIFKTSMSGIVDTNFITTKPLYQPAAIFDFDNAVLPDTGSDFITAVADDVVLLSFRANPITGNLHHMPLKFDRTGSLKRIAGDDYINSYRWEEVWQMFSINNNSVIISGLCALVNNDGELQEACPVIASYDKNTRVQGIIYKAQNYLTDVGDIRQVYVREG